MPIYLLDRRLIFPDPYTSPGYGPMAVGGDLRTERLELAYRSGIFPWYNEGQPILWYSPDPRFVLLAPNLQINRSLRKRIRKQEYQIRLDTHFSDVIRECSKVPRPGQDGTWITNDMLEAYIELHHVGLGHSAEAWKDGQLVGGVYGVSVGGAFFGESMFAKQPDASKIAFVALVQQLQQWGIQLIDCQVHTKHLERFGAIDWPREDYLATLQQALQIPTRYGPWSFDQDFVINTNQQHTP